MLEEEENEYLYGVKFGLEQFVMSDLYCLPDFLENKLAHLDEPGCPSLGKLLSMQIHTAFT